jgi:predicted phage terminase large subunit-like protein
MLASSPTNVSLRVRSQLTPKLTKYIPHEPTVKQTAFLLLPHREAFYGGAAGGGKSDALLMAALQYVDVPGYAALLLRRTYSDLTLPGSLMDRANTWLRGTDATWNDREKTWTFPSGAKITFGYLAKETDKYRYKSAEFQFVGFDELTQFTQTMYLYLITRLRRLKGATVPLRLRSASNPGDIGHEWVRQRFVDYRPHIIPGSKSEVIFRTVRPFIKARLPDNPHLDAEEYRENFSEVDPVTREQLLSGDWEVHTTGSKFKAEDFCRFIHESEIPPGLSWIRYWDLAATEPKPNARDRDKGPDYTVGALIAYHERTGDWICRDIARCRKDPAETEQFIVDTAERDGLAVKIYMEQEPGASGKTVTDDYKRKVLVGYQFKGIRSTGNKEVRALIFASAVGNHKFVLVRARWNTTFIKECEVFPMAGYHDDQVDAVSGAMQRIRGKRRARVVGRTRQQIEASQQQEEHKLLRLVIA